MMAGRTELNTYRLGSITIRVIVIAHAEDGLVHAIEIHGGELVSWVSVVGTIVEVGCS
jgi:acyl-CoA hydrolase